MMERIRTSLDDKNIIILDGSVGDQLKNVQEVMCLGSTLSYKDGFSNASYANIIHPDIVYKVHESYVRYCDVITTNSFGCTLQALQKSNIQNYRDVMVSKACDIARKAASATQDRALLVAGSLGPLGECYLDDCPNELALEEEYGKLIRLLVTGGVDFIICETMSSYKEASCACRQVRNIAPQKLLWVSFTLDDTLPRVTDHHVYQPCILRSGESLEVAIRGLINDLGESSLWAVLVNCCHVRVADAAVKILFKTLQGSGIRYGAYANGFKRTTTEWIMKEYQKSYIDESRYLVSEKSASCDDIYTPEEYADHAEQWIMDGATIIGGCCGIGPDHIRVLYNRVKDNQSTRSKVTQRDGCL